MTLPSVSTIVVTIGEILNSAGSWEGEPSYCQVGCILAYLLLNDCRSICGDYLAAASAGILDQLD